MTSLASWRYALFALLTLIPVPVIGWLLGNNWLMPLLAFVLVPLLDLVVGRDPRNPSPEQERRLATRWRFRLGLYAQVPVQLALIVWGAMVIASGQLSASQALGLTLSIGLSTGGQGIMIAHELGHKKSLFDRALAWLLLVSVSYGHFYIEHNRGHHARVATPDDPATARFGESFYRFYPRAVAGSFASAWRLERERLRRRALPLLHWRNQMLWFGAAPAAIALLLWLAFGRWAVLFFFAQSWVAFSLLELINYVEHYGLERARRADGGLERVTHLDSWNASETLTNWCLLNLQRHADHHAHPARPYQTLRHYDDSPQLPTGYPGMALVALLPPLWYRLMNPRVEQLRGRNAGPAPA
ncbi:MAG: alkane 1-monooxygenase [Rubrivivax sp.]